MSYILEALRKAERERADSTVPSIASEYQLPAPPGRPRWPWILGAALVLNVVLAAGLIAILRQPAPPAAPADTPAASRTATAGPAAPGTPGAAPQAAGPTTAPAPQTSGPSVPVASATPGPPAAPPKPASPAPAGSPAPSQSSGREASPPVVERPALGPAPGSGSAAPAGSPPAVSPPRPAPLREPATAPTASGVAPAGAARYHLDVHVYSETSASRMVFINGQKYVEGQRVDEHTVLEAITAEGAVLNQQGQRRVLRP